MALITPRTPPGVMELLPPHQVAFQHLLDTIRRGYERFGFLPIETPAFETVEVLLTKSGGETEKQIYFVQSTGARQQGKEAELALRFDLTVPLARYVAEHERDLAFPFRRYQIQRVYRGERAQKGRYREFYQCDIDVIGKDSLALHYDAEMPAVISHVFDELKIGRFTISINNRKLLRGLLEGFGVAAPEAQAAVLREIDKLDKTGIETVRASLCGPELGLEPDRAGRLLDLIALADRPRDIIAYLKRLPDQAPALTQGLEELATVVAGMAALGVPEERFRINLAIARGLDYYTGTVYETSLDAFPGVGSVCSGGRYDDLASQYTRSRLPGVGLSIGATRLFSQLLDAGVIRARGGTTQVLVTQLDPALLTDYLGIAATLRAAGLNTEVQLEPARLARQMKYADRAGIPFAVIMGSDEKARGAVTLKDLAAGAQYELPVAGLAGRILELTATLADKSL